MFASLLMGRRELESKLELILRRLHGGMIGREDLNEFRETVDD
jgi:hypothetical protein